MKIDLDTHFGVLEVANLKKVILVAKKPTPTLTVLPWWLISLSSSILRLSMYVCRITFEIWFQVYVIFFTSKNGIIRLKISQTSTILM